MQPMPQSICVFVCAFVCFGPYATSPARGGILFFCFQVSTRTAKFNNRPLWRVGPTSLFQIDSSVTTSAAKQAFCQTTYYLPQNVCFIYKSCPEFYLGSSSFTHHSLGLFLCLPSYGRSTKGLQDFHMSFYRHVGQARHLMADLTSTTFSKPFSRYRVYSVAGL